MRDELTLRREANAAATALLLLKMRKPVGTSVVSSLEAGLRFCDFVIAGVKNNKAKPTDRLSYEDFETMRFATRLTALASDVVTDSAHVRSGLELVLERLRTRQHIPGREMKPLFEYFTRVSDLLLAGSRQSTLMEDQHDRQFLPA
jgi:hypothetical protein